MILALALVGGLAFGAAAAAIAIARQSDSSYRRIAESVDAVHYEFGLGVTPAEFDSLLEAAHGHGLKVMLDGVFNHVGRGFPASPSACRAVSAPSTASTSAPRPR